MNLSLDLEERFYNGDKHFTENEWVILVSKDPNRICKLKEPTLKIQLAVIENHPYNIQYISDTYDEVKMTAVKSRGYSLQYIKNPSEEIIIEALIENPSCIKFIKYTKDLSEKVQIEYVKSYFAKCNNSKYYWTNTNIDFDKLP